MRSRGFALLAVLWTVTVLGVAVASGAGLARLGQRTTGNRITMVRSRWAAEACLAVVERRAEEGRLSDSSVVDLGRSVTCAWNVTRPDAWLDVNTVPRDALARLAAAVGVRAERAEQFAEAVAAGRRSRAFTDAQQLADLAGADARVLPFLTVDGSGRVDAMTASWPVLLSLPGMTPEAAGLVLQWRNAGRPFQSLDELGGAASAPARAALHGSFPELAPLLAFGSGRMVVTATGWVGSYGRYPQATIEIVAQRLPNRLAVLRRRVR